MKVTIYRSADYALREPMWKIEIVDRDNLPMNLAGYTFLTAYKVEVIPLEFDPNDAESFINHKIVFNPAGAAITTTGMYPGDSTGIIIERFTRAETATLPADVELVSDVRFIDPNGEEGIIPIEDIVVAVNPVTNRST